MDLILPELDPCPTHPDGQNRSGFASCQMCWKRFYFGYEFQKVIDRINRIQAEYARDVERAKQVLVP